MHTALDVQKSLRNLANPARAQSSLRFFKTGKGQYGEGDQFIGVDVPQQRRIAKEFRDISLTETIFLLKSPIHEDRLTALFILVNSYERAKGEPNQQERVVRAYLRHIKHVNNWDLVDSSAAKIWGHWLLTRERDELYLQIRSPHLWTRRVAMVATHSFIRHGQGEDALALAELLLGDKEDLMHKAAGWMLRELGSKVELAQLRGFLTKNVARMPRTMLRYSIEKLPEPERMRWLKA